MIVSSDMDSKVVPKSMQHRKEWTRRSEPWNSNMNRLPTNVRSELEGNDDVDWLRKINPDEVACLLRYESNYESLKKGIQMSAEEDREEKLKSKPNIVPSKLTSSGKTSCPQTSNNKNTDDQTRHKTLAKDARDHSGDVELKQEDENVASGYKPRKKDGTQFEVIPKDEAQGNIRRNVYAGGDMDLRTTKSHILGVIDRALNNESGASLDQQKNADSTRGLTQQDIRIDIMHALQGDCCPSLAEDSLSHRMFTVDVIKRLKLIRWEYMNHIQDEIRKLCKLQKYLDIYSPRQSLPTLQTHPPPAVEQQTDERQPQQHEEKHNLGTNS